MRRRPAAGRPCRELFRRALAWVCRALVPVAWCAGGLVMMDVLIHPDRPDLEPLEQPPPGHPERLVLDEPLSPTEAGLWQQILSDDPAA